MIRTSPMPAGSCQRFASPMSPPDNAVLEIRQPDAALAVCGDRGDRPAVEVVGQRDRFPVPVRNPAQTAGGRDPEHAGRVGVHRRQRRTCDRLRLATLVQLSVHELNERVDVADPHAAIGRGLHAADEPGIDDLRHLVRRQSIESIERGDPDVAFTIFEEALDRIIRESRERGAFLDRLRRWRHAPETLPTGSHPQIALPVVEEPDASAGVYGAGRRVCVIDRAEAVDGIGDPRAVRTIDDDMPHDVCDVSRSGETPDRQEPG